MSSASLSFIIALKTADDNISPEEIKYIREVVEPRLEVLHNGTAVTHDFDEACDEINKKVFE